MESDNINILIHQFYFDFFKSNGLKSHMSVHLLPWFGSAWLTTSDRTECSVEFRSVSSWSSLEVMTFHRPLEPLTFGDTVNRYHLDIIKNIKTYTITNLEFCHSSSEWEFSDKRKITVCCFKNNRLITISFDSFDLYYLKFWDFDKRYWDKRTTFDDTSHFELFPYKSSHLNIKSYKTINNIIVSIYRIWSAKIHLVPEIFS